MAKLLVPDSKLNTDGSHTVRCQDGPHRGEVTRIYDDEVTLVWLGRGCYFLSRSEDPGRWGLTWEPNLDKLGSLVNRVEQCTP